MRNFLLFLVIGTTDFNLTSFCPEIEGEQTKILEPNYIKSPKDLKERNPKLAFLQTRNETKI